jgi:hypothetical protein
MISENKYLSTALDLGIDVNVIKAVAHVETGGQGFIDEKPVICFEPHIFWQQLIKRKINPEQFKYQEHPVQDLSGKVNGTKRIINEFYDDILYLHWGAKPYPYGQSARYRQLDKAATINRDAALASCSWGKFQIMGFNYKLCGCKTLQEFINDIYRSEDDHLELFEQYIKNCGLVGFLKRKNFDGFAEGYNGPLYKRNDYAVKMQKQYEWFIHQQ